MAKAKVNTAASDAVNEAMKDEPDLTEVTKKVDELWQTRKRADEALSALLYQAWLIFQGKRGAPKKDENGTPVATFSSYLRESQIPSSTAKDMIRKHRAIIGEISALAVIEEPEWDEELDGTGQFADEPTSMEHDQNDEEGETERNEHTVSDDSNDGVEDEEEGFESGDDTEAEGSLEADTDKPTQSAPAVDLKARTPEFYKERRATLEKELRGIVRDKAKAQAIIDQGVVNFLESQLHVLRKKVNTKVIRETNAALIAELKSDKEVRHG